MAVRRERVVLELQDNFTTGMARAAASAALLNRELDSLSHDSIRTKRSMSDIDSGAVHLGRTSETSGRQIDKLSGRIGLLGEAIAVLGPGLIPIGAVGIPALTGLASELGFVAIAGGTAVLAFQGIGDALKLANKAAVQPTAANLAALQATLEKLSPAAQGFVAELGRLRPELTHLRDLAATGLLPGLTSGLDALEAVLPKVEAIVGGFSKALGDLANDAGASLASDRWAPFLDFVATEGPSALADFGTAIGNVAHTLSELWMATQPLNAGFSRFLVNSTADLDKWASGLSQTQGFADFMAYVDKNGPRVAETFGAIAQAAIQIVEAAAPLGGPVLEGVQAFAKAVSAIADSDLGTPLFLGVAALSLFNRGLKATEALSAFGTRLDVAGEKTKRFGRNINAAGLGRASLLMGGLALASTGAADGIGLTDTAALALAGSAGGPLGLALGAATGFTFDLIHANDQLTTALNGAELAAKSSSTAQIEAARAALLTQATALANGNGFKDNLARISAFIGGQDIAIGKAAADLNATQDSLLHGPLAGVGSLLTQGLGLPARQAALDIDGAEAATSRFNTALSTLNGNLSQSQTLIQQRNALRGLADVVKQNPLGVSLTHGLGKTGAQGDAVRSQLLSIIQLTLQAASGLKEIDQIPFLRRQRSSILQAAKDLGIPLDAVKKLLNSFGVVDRTKITPKVDPNPAKKGIREVQTALEKFLNRDYAVKIRTELTNPGKVGGLGALLLQPITPADGTTVPGARFPYRDRIPALLAPGEEVISNRFGQADRHRELLKRINDNRMAMGGTVQPFASSVSNTFNSSGAQIDYGKLAQALAHVRAPQPLYGPVSIQPHNYSEFTRQMENDRRMAASDGIQR